MGLPLAPVCKRPAETVACLTRAWRRAVAPELLCHRLTVSGLCASWPYPPLRRRGRGGRYSSGNQISTYELLTRIANSDHYAHARSRSDRIAALAQVDAAVRAAAPRYGTYAGINAWSPTFTLAQLRAFAELAHDAVAAA